MIKGAMTEDDIANLSDEELMGLASAPILEGAPDEGAYDEQDSEDQDTGSNEDDDDQGNAADDASASDADSGDDTADEDDDVEDENSDADLDDSHFEEKKAPKKEPKADADKKETAETDKADLKTKDVKVEADKAVDYKAAYDKIMAPFKANGKEIRLDSPEDVVRLMQMGADYTRKLQALKPNLALMRMLEKEGLLSAEKLTYLIDLDKKNPAAIKQMIKDSGVDPMDIDTAEDTGYKPGNYQVSDEEMRFNSTVEEVASDPVGKELITTIHKTWDQQSKDALWQDPEILRILTQHRKAGFMSRITDEVERRKILGHISQDMPFLAAYREVGQDLDKQGLLQPVTAAQSVPQKGADGQPKTAAPDSGRKVLDQRTGLRKPGSAVANNDKARAASPAKGMPPKKGTVDFNPLSMSDEDFEKNASLAQKL